MRLSCMRTMAWVVVAGSMAGCPADDDPTPGETESGSSSGTTTETTNGTTSTDAGTGTDSGTTTSGSTEGTSGMTTEGATDGTTSEDSETGSTGGASDPCAELDREACQRHEGCEPIACRPFEAGETAGEYCIGDPEFIGCHAAGLDCGQARTVTCEDETAVFVCATTCIPQGWTTCDPPTDGDVQPCAE
jgi:hypothetical protein